MRKRVEVHVSDHMPQACPLPHETRRGFLSNLLMILGIVAGYGLGLLHFLRYLVPLHRKTPRRELFAGTLAELPVGSSRTLKDLRGEGITLARVADVPDDPARGFRALSSVCPHLGCKVHWESANNRFFCPCHNGVFNKDGIAVSGPPAHEKKNLSTFEVKVNKDNGWVYVLVSGEAGHA